MLVPAVVLSIFVSGLLGPRSAVVQQPCWTPPVQAAIAEPFRRPACLWCSGHRGLTFANRPGVAVRAVATGVVTFAGVVVDTRYLVVRHRDGRRVTYGNVADVGLRVGTRVLTGGLIGVATGPLYFGVRDAQRYLDPTPMLGSWRTRARLIPVGPQTPRRAPPPVLRCGERPPVAAPKRRLAR